jgi:hypothetical protein
VENKFLSIILLFYKRTTEQYMLMIKAAAAAAAATTESLLTYIDFRTNKGIVGKHNKVMSQHAN